MLQVELAVAAIVTVVDYQVGVAEVVKVGNYIIAHLLPVFLDDDPLVSLFPVDVEIKVFHQVFGEVVTQEGDVVVKFAYFEDLLTTHAGFASKSLSLLPGGIIPALLDVFKHLEAQVVRVERGS